MDLQLSTLPACIIARHMGKVWVNRENPNELNNVVETEGLKVIIDLEWVKKREEIQSVFSNSVFLFSEGGRKRYRGKSRKQSQHPP